MSKKLHAIKDIFYATDLLEGAVAKQQEDGTFIIEDATLIRAGLSANSNYYPADVLKAAVPKYNGVQIMTDHPSLTSPHSVKDVIGKIQETYWDPVKNAIKARKIVFSSTAKDILTKVSEGLIGDLSHNARGETEQNRRAGKIVREVNEIAEVFSVDLVTRAAAGGSLHEAMHDRFRQTQLACERMSDNMGLIDDINLEELAKARPDLLKEHKRDILKDNPPAPKTKQDDAPALTLEGITKAVSENVAEQLAEHQKIQDKKADAIQREADIDKATGVALSESAATDKVKAILHPGLRSFVSSLKEFDAKVIAKHRDDTLDLLAEAAPDFTDIKEKAGQKKDGEKTKTPLHQLGFPTGEGS